MVPVTAIKMARHVCHTVFIWTLLSVAKAEVPNLNLLENTNIYTTIYKLDNQKELTV